jgi:hypothetical protein
VPYTSKCTSYYAWDTACLFHYISFAAIAMVNIIGVLASHASATVIKSAPDCQVGQVARAHTIRS